MLAIRWGGCIFSGITHLRKIAFGIQFFPNFKANSIDLDSHLERIKDSKNIANLPRICVKVLQSKPRKLSNYNCK